MLLLLPHFFSLQEHSKTTVQSLGDILFNSENRKDVDVVCKDGIITGHSLILSTRSKFMETALKDIWQLQHAPDDHRFTINLNDRDRSDVHEIIKFCYTDKINITEENMENLFSLADYLEIQDLMELMDR